MITISVLYRIYLHKFMKIDNCKKFALRTAQVKRAGNSKTRSQKGRQQQRNVNIAMASSLIGFNLRILSPPTQTHFVKDWFIICQAEPSSDFSTNHDLFFKKMLNRYHKKEKTVYKYHLSC